MCMSVFQFNVDTYISLILHRKLVFTCLHQVVQAQPHDGWVFCLDIIFDFFTWRASCDAKQSFTEKLSSA